MGRLSWHVKIRINDQVNISKIKAKKNLVLGCWLLLSFCALSSAYAIQNTVHPVLEHNISVKLWNGNKTQSRQQYEREVLEAALKATKQSHGKWSLQEDLTDYPLAADEASVFRSKGFDIFGTVAGAIASWQMKRK